MRAYQILLALLFGGLALWAEFRSVKEFALFTEWLNFAPFWTLCSFAIILLVINLRQYFFHKTFVSFLPFLICVTSLFIAIWHQNRREQLDSSPTKFRAYTYDIGNDGGFVLDFKVNGHLKAEKQDHWSVTHYWGKYSQSDDTVNLIIPLNFELGRLALLTTDSFRIVGDTTEFFVFRQ